MNSQELRNLQEAYNQVYELDEATAMAKRGLDEPAIRSAIAKKTGGGSFADKATKLADRQTYGDKKRKMVEKILLENREVISVIQLLHLPAFTVMHTSPMILR